VSDIAVEVLRKPIKHLHLGVYPPHGRVRVAAPLAVSDEAVRLAIVDKLGWIRRQQATFNAQPRQSPREMVNGETHYFRGRPYRLRVVAGPGPARVALRGGGTMELRAGENTGAEQRHRALQDWYRQRLREVVPALVLKWQSRLGVQPSGWGIKKMKTKWGSCRAETGRIWVNLELAKKPPECLEYIVVHELAHLLERRHNERFAALMDGTLPGWRLRKDELNETPLAHEKWAYKAVSRHARDVTKVIGP